MESFPRKKFWFRSIKQLLKFTNSYQFKKCNIEAAGIPSQSATGKGAVFLLDSGIVGETAPMVNIFMENLKRPRFQKNAKISVYKIYRFLCGKRHKAT